MSELSECPICGGVPDQQTYHASGRYYYLRCPRCCEMVIDARFIEDDDASRILGDIGSRRRADASAWLSRQHEITNLRTRESLEALAAVVPPPLLERAEMLLLMLEARTQRAGEAINVNADEFVVGTWSIDSEEVAELVLLLADRGEVTVNERELGLDAPVNVSIALHGWEHIEMIRRGDQSSGQGFVAMWFDDSMAPAFNEAIAPAVEAAGYQAHRVDKREFEGRIDDEIIAQIRRSRFVVADFTGHRGGVYYEAGFAHGHGLPVFFTCREDALDGLHFDIRQYNTIVWKDHDDLRTRLQNRIEAVLGRGPFAND